MRRGWLIGLVFFGTCAALVGTAWGQNQSAADRATARTFMRNADARFAVRDYAEALKLYQAADDIMHVPTTGLAVAKALAELHG